MAILAQLAAQHLHRDLTAQFKSQIYHLGICDYVKAIDLFVI